MVRPARCADVLYRGQLSKISIPVNIFVHLKKFAMILFTNPSAQAGYDTRSIFKRSLTGLNSEFYFS